MPTRFPIEVMHCTDFGRLEIAMNSVRLDHSDNNQSNLYELSEKHLLKCVGVGRELSHDEARLLTDSFLKYRLQLKASAWLIPEVHELKLMDTDLESHIWIAEECIEGYAGTDLLGECPSSVSTIFIQKVINQVYSTARSDSADSSLDAAVDLKPSNLVMDNTGRVWLVDTIAPKPLDNNGNLELYIDKLEELDACTIQSICATLDGVILRFLRKCLEAWTTISHEDFVSEISYALELLNIPLSVKSRWLAQIDDQFPYLDKIYSN